MNKKAEGDAGLSIQQVLFYAAELAVGALIILLVLQLVFFSVRDAEAQVIARDFAATLKTMSVYPYTSYFFYPADLSAGSINIYEDRVRVNMDKGSHTAPLNLARGITVQERNFLNPQSIPIIKFGNEFFFSGEGLSEMNCDKTYKLQRGQNFFINYESESEQERQKLDELKKGIELIHSVERQRDSNRFQILNREGPDTIKITISFNTEEHNLLVFESSKKEHEGFACYLREEFLKKDIANKPTLFSDFKESEDLELRIPSVNHLNNYLSNETFKEHREQKGTDSTTELMQTYAKAIYDALTKTIREQNEI